MSLTICSAGAFSGPGFCLIFAPDGYDDPEFLRSRNPSICLTGADGGQGFGLGIVQGAFAQSDQPRVQAGEQAAPAPAIPMEQVLAQLKAEGYGEVYEIEREHGKYEVKAKNRDGRTVELSLDASTGKTLETEEEDDH
jgi:hypothetical protein